jgi:DMSO/TMAO reductase YedYZ molybdopterin-dependent catalytic subunit
MKTRRQFIKSSVKFLSGLVMFFSTIGAWLEKVYAKGTDLSSLRNENPATLDTRDLEVLPLKAFETMGQTDHEVHLKSWRLLIEGNVATPIRLPYSRIIELPSIERKVLLICPGIFTNHGIWKGISLMTVLKLAGIKADYEKVEKFPIGDIRSDKVFLAYQVNGQRLPQKHGFPLRIVAEDYYGDEWVKYVYKVEAIKVTS